MTAIRRAYIYIALFISLQAVTWAIISLGRNLINRTDQDQLAFQLAIVLIGGPFFFGHWRWAQQLVANSEIERRANIRTFYFYAVLTSFLGPAMQQSYRIIDDLLGTIGGETLEQFGDGPIALAILAILFVYHINWPTRDRQGEPETDWGSLFRRLYQWGFVITGLIIVSVGTVSILVFIINELTGEINPSGTTLLSEIARILVGGAIWAYFWHDLSLAFRQNRSNEQQDVLRKVALYLFVLVGVSIFVTFTAALWDQILLRLLQVDSNAILSDGLPLIILGAAIWQYHAYRLRQDEKIAPFTIQQLVVENLYSYLVAAVGLITTLIGVIGLLSIMIRVLIDGEGPDQRVIAGFLATLSAGLPVWFSPWWRIQGRVNGPPAVALRESGRFTRRVYLYGFLLIASLLVLGSSIYLVYRILLIILQASNSETVSDLAQAITYALIGAGLWIYHWRLLQTDGWRVDEAEGQKINGLSISIETGGNDELSQQIERELSNRLPNMSIWTSTDDSLPDFAIGTYAGLVDRFNDQTYQSEGVDTVRKVILPIGIPNGVWVGVDSNHVDNLDSLVEEGIDLIKRLALTDNQVRRKGWGIGSILGAIFVGLIALIIFSQILSFIVGFLI